MKFLGWILLLSSNIAFSQQVIEPAPLSVQDDNTSREIVVRKEGDTEVKHVEKGEVVAPPAAVELTPPNDEVVNPPVDKNAKKKKPQKVAKASKSKAKPQQIAAEKPVETSEALTTAPATPPTPNPVDGQLVLEPSKNEVAPKTEIAKAPIAAVEEKAEKKADEVSSPILTPIAVWEKEPRKYIQLAFGYINSRYEKIHKTLDNGSVPTSLKFFGDINSHVQTGFGIEMLSDTSSQKVPDNIRVVQYRLFGEYHAPLTHIGPVRLDWLLGGAFSLGEFGIKRRYLNASNEEVSVKIKNGTIIGLIPTAGLRFYVIGPYSVDLMVEYHQYFGNPQKYIGGLGVAPRLNFPF